MSLKVRVDPSKAGREYKQVVFIKDGKESSHLMPADMARSIEARLNAMAEFSFGIVCGLEIVAMFRYEGDRDDAIASRGDWERLDG